MPSDDSLPPFGDHTKGQKYINQLSALINSDSLTVSHSDLKKFDIGCMQDHYRIDLNKYQVELSHSKHPTSGEDLYVLLFNGLKSVTTLHDRVTLSYIHLSKDQFTTLKYACDEQLERVEFKRQEKRFVDAMAPIDEVLDSLKPAEKPIEEPVELTQQPAIA